MSLKNIPVVIKLYPSQVHNADLLKELKINPHHLTRELRDQAGRYAWWSSLYATVAAKVSKLKEELEFLEAKKAIFYNKQFRKNGKARRVTDIKYQVSMSPSVKSLRREVRRWENSERILKYAERSFQQRKDMLQMLAAADRREKESEEDNE